MKKIPTYKKCIDSYEEAKKFLSSYALHPSLHYNLASNMDLILQGLYEKYGPANNFQAKDNMLIVEASNPEWIAGFNQYCKEFFTLCDIFTIDLHYNFFINKMKKNTDNSYFASFIVMKELV